MKKIIICDDEPLEVQNTVEVLSNYFSGQDEKVDFVIERDGEEFLQKCKEGRLVPELVFMDIEMGHKTGIEVVTELNSIYPRCVVVYLSNYLQYTLDVYTTDHFYYILKPQLEDRLDHVMEKISQYQQEVDDRISVKLKYNEMVNLPADGICYFERKGRKTHIVTEKNIFESYQALDELMKDLTSDFIRCHNSYIVNMRKILNYKRERLTVAPSTEIPISRQYQGQVKDLYMSWFRAHML